MFITRATRHDRDDVAGFLADHDFGDSDLTVGTTFVARDGGIVGCVRLIEVAPQAVVVVDVVVKTDRRGEGIGARLIQAAMNSRGGRLYLCCHPERLRFYSHFGFEEVAVEDCPAEVVDYWRGTEDYPTAPDHIHHYMKAR